MRIIALTLFLSTAISSWAAGGVLMIGDSLSVGYVGSEVVRALSLGGARARVVASGGSKPRDWTTGRPIYWNQWGYTDDSNSHHESRSHRLAKREPYANPKLRDLVHAERPALVVIQLGTNLMWDFPAAPTPKQIAALEREVRALAKEAYSVSSVRGCLWVAPPDTSKFSSSTENHIYQIIARATRGRCEVLDSRDPQRIGVYPAAEAWLISDGVHHAGARGGAAVRKRWTQALIEEILKQAPSTCN